MGEMEGLGQKFIELVHNPIFWWPFAALRPESGQKITSRNLAAFLILYNIFIAAIGLVILWLIYWPFSDLISEASYIFWTIVLTALGMGLIFNTVLYLVWAFLWNKGIK